MTITEKRDSRFEWATHILKLDETNQMGFELQDGSGKPIGRIDGVEYTTPEKLKEMLDELVKYLRSIGATNLYVADKLSNELISQYISYGFGGEVRLDEYNAYLEMKL